MKHFYDNTPHDLSEFSFLDSEKDDLRQIAGKKLSELVAENQNLLVFPPDIKNCEDKIGNLTIFELDKDETKLQTGNLMGFIGVGGTEIRIKSRFDNSENDFFLQYMLSKVFKINLFDYKTTISDSENSLNLLYFAFPALLNRALTKGVFRQYQTFDRNDSAVKGAIDLPRHIKQNLPFNGKIAYRSREFCYDNPITQLIRHTIETIRTSVFGQNILKNNEQIRENVAQIVQATPTYNRRQRLEIIRKNSKPIKNGFFAEYADLQRLCLLILQHKTALFKTNNREIYGILFDGAWLWEEYLWTILKDFGFIHPENKTGKGGIYLFKNCENSSENGVIDDKTYHSRYRRYPDFYRKGEWILDAKYKHLESGKIARDDMHQIIAYMYVEQATKGGLIYPLAEENALKQEIGELRGHGGKIEIFGVPIPQNQANFAEFLDKIKDAESKMIENFLQKPVG